MAVFTSADRYQAFIDVAEARNACESAMIWCRARGEITFGEGLQQMLRSDDFRPAWSHWAWNKLTDVIDAAAREVFFQIILKEPQTASVVYLEEPNLTGAQDQRLWDAFSSQLPAMKRGIESGKFKRAKTVA